MAGYGFSRRVDLGGSANSSSVTLGPVLVTDWRQMSLSIVTSNGSASNHTIQGSNDDGLTSSIVSWSNLSVVNATGIVKLDVGVRWVRLLRPSVDSTTVYSLAGYVG